jgi:uridine kinase
VWRRPALAGGRRLVLVDGLAGAGKTTLAALFADALRREDTVTVVAMDDLYEGWGGLPGVGRLVHQQLVRPLVDGIRPRVARWDWHAARRRAPEPLPLADVVLLEGVGSWSSQLAPWTTLLVWVESPPDRRHSRALARDGEVFAPHWDAWAADERRLLAREATRAHADVVWPTDDR